MTIQVREKVTWGLFIFSGLFFTSAVIFYLTLSPIELSEFYSKNDNSILRTIFIAFTCLYALAFSGIIALKNAKSSSLEIFFFMIWLACIPLELFRILTISSFVIETGISFYKVITRVVLFGRYCAVLSLFTGSLFSTGLKTERMNIIMVLMFALTMFFASTYPLNSTELGSDFLLERGRPALGIGFEIVVTIIIVINYMIAWRLTRNNLYQIAGICLVITIGAIMIIRSTDSLFVFIPSFIVLSASSYFYLKSLQDFYLWS